MLYNCWKNMNALNTVDELPNKDSGTIIFVHL